MVVHVEPGVNSKRLFGCALRAPGTLLADAGHMSSSPGHLGVLDVTVELTAA
jgi:hypothetical protein